MHPIETRAAAEFDRWAEAGRADTMADGHRDVTGQLLDRWTLTSEHHLLDVGCGNGWAVRCALERGAGEGSGVDVSPAMIDQARRGPGHFTKSRAADLPFADATFTHVLSVESLYYYPDPGAALAEWARVTAPGGHLGVVIDLYQESPGTHAWPDAFGFPVHLLGADRYRQLAEAAGWREVQTFRLHDRRPGKDPDSFIPSPYWPSFEHYLRFREDGSLAITGRR